MVTLSVSDAANPVVMLPWQPKDNISVQVVQDDKHIIEIYLTNFEFLMNFTDGS